MKIIIICHSGKPVWMGTNLQQGEKWCAVVGIEYDYVLTLGQADMDLVVAETFVQSFDKPRRVT